MSEVGNMISVFGNGWKLCRSNDTVSFGYIVLLFVLFASGMLRKIFLDASSHLYIRVCPSVGWSVRWLVHRLVRLSVGWSVRRSVRNHFF